MNKVFKLKFNKHSKELVVVSELATNYDVSKDSSTSAKLNISSLGKVIASGALTGLALASATAGADTATQVGTIASSVGEYKLLNNANGYTKIQTTQNNTVLNWNDFTVGLKNAVEFAQPNTSSVVLNRVLGQKASEILGQIHSNGGVYLVNPNGVLFGKNSKVDVASLVASTLNLSNEQVAEFAKNGQLGKLESAAQAAAVINSGVITVRNGNLHLVGGNVLNAGTLKAEKGSVYLLAGQSVTLVDAKNPLVTYSLKAGNKAVNVGALVAAQQAVVNGKEANVRNDLNGFEKVFGQQEATALKVDAKEGLFLVAESNAEVIGEFGNNVKVGKLDVQTSANSGAKVRLYNVNATSLDVRSNGDVEVKSSNVDGNHVNVYGANSLTVDNSKFEVTGDVEVKKSAKVKFSSAKVNAKNVSVTATDSLEAESTVFKADNFTADAANKVNFNDVRAAVANELSVSGDDVNLDAFVATAKNAAVVGEGVNLNVSNSNLQAQNVLLASDKDVNLANTTVKAEKAKLFAFNANVNKGSNLKTSELETGNLYVAGKSSLQAENKLTVRGETQVKEKSAVSTSNGEFSEEVSVKDSQLTSKGQLLFNDSLKVSNGLLAADSVFVGNDDKTGVTRFEDKSSVQAKSFFSGNEEFSANLTTFEVNSFNVDVKKNLELSNTEVNAEDVRLNSEENLTLADTRVNANSVNAFATEGELLLKGPNTKVLSKGDLELEALITTLTDGATAKGETTKVSGSLLLVNNNSHLETNNSSWRHDLDLEDVVEVDINEADGSTARTYTTETTYIPVVEEDPSAVEDDKKAPEKQDEENKPLIVDGKPSPDAYETETTVIPVAEEDPEAVEKDKADLEADDFVDEAVVVYSDPAKELTPEEESKEVKTINEAADLEDLEAADKKLEEESTTSLKDDKTVDTGYVENTVDLGKTPYEDHLGTLTPEEEELLAALEAEELEKGSQPGDNLPPAEGPTETTVEGGSDTAGGLKVDGKPEKDAYVMTGSVAIKEDSDQLSEEDKAAMADVDALAADDEAAKSTGEKEGDNVPGIDVDGKVEKDGYVTASTTDESDDQFVVSDNSEESSEEISNEAFMADLTKMITPEVAADEEKQQELVSKYPALKQLIEEQVAAKKKAEENALTQPDGKTGPDAYVTVSNEADPTEEELDASIKELLEKDAELAKAEEEARLKEDMEDLKKADEEAASDKTPVTEELVVTTEGNPEDETQEFESGEPALDIPEADDSDKEHAVYVDVVTKADGEDESSNEEVPTLIGEDGNKVEPTPVPTDLLPKSDGENGNPIVLDQNDNQVNKATDTEVEPEGETTTPVKSEEKVDVPESKSTVEVTNPESTTTTPTTTVTRVPAAQAETQATETAKDTNDLLKDLGTVSLPSLGDVALPSTNSVAATNFADALATADGTVTLPGTATATPASRVSFASARPASARSATSSSQATASKATEGKKAGKVTLASGKRSCGAVLDEVYDKYRVKDDDRDIEYFVQNVTKYKIRPFDQQKVRKVCTIDDEPKVPAKVAKVVEKSADTNSESTGE